MPFDFDSETRRQLGYKLIDRIDEYFSGLARGLSSFLKSCARSLTLATLSLNLVRMPQQYWTIFVQK